MENKSELLSRLDVKAFTLIELLVVVLIIGILAAVALPQYQKAVDKTRFMQALTMHKAVYDAQQVFYLTNGRYAGTWGELADLDLPTPASGGGENDTYAWWKWGYCFLTSRAYGGCGIELPGGQARTLQYWSSRNKNCYALKTSARAQRTCEAVTGKSFSQATSGDNDYVYSF